MASSAVEQHAARHSCDELLMTRSLHHDPAATGSAQGFNNEDGGLLSDSTSSQLSVSNYHLAGGYGKEQTSDTTSDTASATGSASGTNGMVCQRCFLNSMSNHALLDSTECC